MSCRRSYRDDPGLCDRVFELLGTWLAELPVQRRRAEALNWRWEDCSTPFVVEEDGRVISHVGLLELPLRVMSQSLRVGGIHAVCTLAERRRRGLYRRVMEEVLDYCKGRHETLVLSTEQPELYEPFGFRVIPEQTFTYPITGARASDLRPLRLQSPDDLVLLDSLLARRRPVSDVVGVEAEHHVFKFNQAGGGLWYSPSLEAVLALELDGERWWLRDVVAESLPPLARLLAALPEGGSELGVCFSPDLLATGGLEGRAGTPPAGEGVFMVRGPFAAEGRPLMVPPTARH